MRRIVLLLWVLLTGVMGSTLGVTLNAHGQNTSFGIPSVSLRDICRAGCVDRK